VPETVVNREMKLTGTAPPAPPAPEPSVPILIAVVTPVPIAGPAVASEKPPSRLPTTASDVPLVGLLGAILCSLSLLSMAIRRAVPKIR
jgi:hypothetical protein